MRTPSPRLSERPQSLPNGQQRHEGSLLSSLQCTNDRRQNLTPNKRLSSSPCMKIVKSPKKVLQLDENLNPHQQHSPSNSQCSMPTPHSPSTLPPALESECLRQQVRRQIAACFSEHYELQTYIFTALYKPLKKAKVPVGPIFGNLKTLRSVYKRVIQLLEAATKTSLSSSSLMLGAADEHDFEQSLLEIFKGKLSATLEREILAFVAHQRTGQWYDRIAALETEDERARPILEAHQKATIATNHRWGDLSLQQMLEQVAAQAAQYPPLLDRLLLETPLQSQPYQLIEKALVGARAIAKTAAAVQLSPNSLNATTQASQHNNKRNIFFLLRSRMANLLRNFSRF